MTCIRFAEEGFSGILCIDPGKTLKIEVSGKFYHFDFSERWGPNVTTKYGGTADQPHWKNPFWRAVSIWLGQGKIVQDGLCVWSEPPAGIDYVSRVSKRSVLHVRSDYPEGYMPDFSETKTVYLDEQAQ
jgi:hypothetical protein